MAHTCPNILKIPGQLYANGKEEFEEKLDNAVTNYGSLFTTLQFISSVYDGAVLSYFENLFRYDAYVKMVVTSYYLSPSSNVFK